MTAEIEAAFVAAAVVGGGRRPAAGGPVTANPDEMVLLIKPPPQQLTVPAGGLVTFDMDGPKTGYQWTVRRIWVSDEGALSTSMGAAVAGIYAGQSSPVLVSPGNGEWIMPTLPNAAMFGSDELVLQYGEHLFVQVTGANVGQSLICSVAYQLYTPHAAARDVQV